jgi:hypothetical protein
MSGTKGIDEGIKLARVRKHLAATLDTTPVLPNVGTIVSRLSFA